MRLPALFRASLLTGSRVRPKQATVLATAATLASQQRNSVYGLISLNTYAGGMARKLIHQRMPLDLDALPNYHSRGQRMQGGISNEEYYRRIRQGESVPRAAVTERRLHTGLKKIHSFSPGPGEHVSIFQVRTSRGTYLRVDGCSLDVLMKEANGNAEGKGLSQRKYFRLFALAICEAILISAGQFYVIIDSLRIGGLLPYTSWEQVHRDFNTIAYVPMSAIDSSSVTTLSILRWFSLTPAITLFLFFGLTEDSKSVYLSRWRVLKIFMLQCWTRGARPTQTIRSIDPHESVDLEAFESQVSKLSVLVHKDVAIN
ncbi:putative Pheromone receptor a2 [Pseudozyma hubeiensis]|nr:putative Pheromone receptor a2 [Pseudozyma hubeiensis]